MWEGWEEYEVVKGEGKVTKKMEKGHYGGKGL